MCFFHHQGFQRFMFRFGETEVGVLGVEFDVVEVDGFDGFDVFGEGVFSAHSFRLGWWRSTRSQIHAR
jgi:hypothetical protein